MQLHQPPRSADVLIVLGSRDDRVALHAAQLANRYHYDTVIVTGGAVHRNPRHHAWQEETEAAHFAAVFAKHSNDKSEVLIEPTARNTGENATLSFQLLQQNAIALPKTVQLVTKPYMERRAIAAFEAQWPDERVRFFVSSAPTSLSEYCNAEYPIDETVQVILKDFQSLIDYLKHGWQTPQTIPIQVHTAVEYLRV